MGMIYKWRNGSHITGIDPAQAVERLSSIPARHGIDEGGLSAEIVLDDSRDVSSPLHPAFQWDNEVAAEQYRLNQARHILSCVVVVKTTEEGKELPETARRMFVAVRKDNEASAHLYVLTTVDTVDQRLQQALRELESLERRFGDIDELAAVFATAAKIRTGMQRRRKAA